MKRCASIIGLIMLMSGCQSQQVVREQPAGPDYGRPLPPGKSALRLITDESRYPDLAAAYHHRDAYLSEALEQSLLWFAAPSSRQFFPFEDVTHERARASVTAMKDLIERSPSEYAFLADVRRMFDVYQSVGYDDRGTVLFTGYYSPDFPASRTRTERFKHPLYKRPDDLVTDPVTGEPRGRKTAEGRVVPYYTRAEIESSNMFAGNELVWVEDALAAFIIHVNGSAKLRLRDGSIMYIGYAGKTDRPYRSLGKAMVEAGLLEPEGVSIQRIRRAYRERPRRVEALMNVNESYVFFTEYGGDNWPAGSLGVKVTPEASLATDKKIYPRGGVVLVDTDTITYSGGRRTFLRFMLDQDTGGAIRAPGRADIFLGIGERVGILAGQQYAEGQLYYLFLKPEYVDQFAIK
jgi:membrane-bound lytic murein transglycosylase A